MPQQGEMSPTNVDTANIFSIPQRTRRLDPMRQKIDDQIKRELGPNVSLEEGILAVYGKLQSRDETAAHFGVSAKNMTRIIKRAIEIQETVTRETTKTPFFDENGRTLRASRLQGKIHNKLAEEFGPISIRDGVTAVYTRLGTVEKTATYFGVSANTIAKLMQWQPKLRKRMSINREDVERLIVFEKKSVLEAAAMLNTTERLIRLSLSRFNILGPRDVQAKERITKAKASRRRPTKEEQEALKLRLQAITKDTLVNMNDQGKTQTQIAGELDISLYDLDNLLDKYGITIPSAKRKHELEVKALLEKIVANNDVWENFAAAYPMHAFVIKNKYLTSTSLTFYELSHALLQAFPTVAHIHVGRLRDSTPWTVAKVSSFTQEAVSLLLQMET